MTQQSVMAIIVNYNSGDNIFKCLTSLRDLNKNLNIEIVVVDNCSTDKSFNLISRKFPDITLIKLNQNLGFAGGVNVGVKKALQNHKDYIWILNNDITLDKNAACLAEAFKDQNIGGASSKIYFAPGYEYHKSRYKPSDRGRVIWYGGGVIDWKNIYASNLGVDQVDRGQYKKSIDTQFLTGCSMMLPVTTVKKIGLFDERYYLYYEDTDYSLRIQKAGLRTVFYPKSIIWHLNASASGGPGSRIHEYYQTRNRILFGFKYAGARAKLALSKEAIKMAVYGTDTQRQAIIDAALSKFGKRYG